MKGHTEFGLFQSHNFFKFGHYTSYTNLLKLIAKLYTRPVTVAI